ncbi:uncharacterized protein ASPGLDRAFT_122671 [Aspergillus glaucus CBS 516.65]|uniref:MARVEL domain-containing protein n=1 Tax=Aspergillus glaucus CBS 516.65 TaxID=1160497 RepID=A0A1L9VPZ5_ASPGL|nr:hypothetical protein ASPGLDRAFT_122671 [Aspergillus glaucus CBS 516.65]OJJ85985.1 hypothetical protein ASPGLDRAFT_122671 [Aspergillus glaucus CBS 516.65]
MRSKKSSVKPSLYPAIPFHIIRIFALLSTIIVGIILALFIYHLHQQNYRLPWVYLVLIVAVVLSLINFTLTTLVHCCCGLSPRLNLTSNTILLLIWLAALGVLCWSMSHTILTTCTETYWGNSTGITVCRIYKAFFSFTVAAVASLIAAVTLDIIVRKRQTRLGSYDPMASNPMMAGGDVKLEDRNSGSLMAADDPTAGVRYYHDVPDPRAAGGLGGGLGHGPGPGRADSVAYSGTGSNVSRNGHLEQYHAGEAQDYSDNAPARGVWGAPRVRFSAVGSGYAQPPEQTNYDPGAYR